MRPVIVGLVAMLAFACGAVPVDVSDERVGSEDVGIPVRPRVEILLSDLFFPSELKFAPDGSLFILDRGRIEADQPVRPSLVRYDLAAGTRTEFGGMPETFLHPAAWETFNGGALGFDFHPDFEREPAIFLCYHRRVFEGSEERFENRLSRFDMADHELVSEHVLIDGIPGGPFHNGCRVLVGPDRKIYLSTGDANRTRFARDLSSLAGKVLRVELDGGIPIDNPLPGSMVFTFGHRNPQGLAFHPETLELWSTEHGAQTNDELNRLIAGHDYGWPDCVGTSTFGQSFFVRRKNQERPDNKPRGRCSLAEDAYRPAEMAFTPEDTVGISDLVVYEGDPFKEWQGDLLIAFLKGERLIRVPLDENRVPATEQTVVDASEARYGRFRDVAVGPDDLIYAVTNPTNDARPPRSGLLLRIAPD